MVHLMVTAYLDGAKFRTCGGIVSHEYGENWHAFKAVNPALYAEYFRRGRDNKSI